MNNWVVKSESNVDRVWVEVDSNGNETGEWRYESLTADTPEVVGVDKLGRPVIKVNRARQLAIVAGSSAVAVAAIEIARQFL